MSALDEALAPAGVEYPESDGSLIAESDWHRDELVDLIFRLKGRYAQRQDVYVSGHLLVYYEEGNPAAVFAPDVMVVLGVPDKERRVYKLWEDGRAPAAVFEVSSRKTWLADQGTKRALCERLRVAEYFLWDPRYEYLTPPLQGFRLVGGSYRALRPDAAGCITSRAMGLRLCPEGHRLELYDAKTGEQLERPGEAAEAARRAVAAAGQAVAAAGQALAAERSARLAAEAEVERLRAEYSRLCGQTGRQAP